ncbi:MAG: hypothetical protein KA117_11660 [Verrucomicrobia bacterium]|nr:hypothetical protein [Verrucomicrobiota bacterium]OQC25805.1 MAG: hypothetical protein BWX68_01200 [Verrucomicrobia bacterium ADurb.Bin063]HOC50536.1 hypothetical protein [Verrucomicrobiota bacterium]HOH40105.1 hypothetical protein [Verrucomicrobiota bacterium]HPW92173.1 hypothetical protein [Verrucomicrobiota bacterium]
MLSDHDQKILPRCPRLGHEITFGYCRRETGGRPCRLILNCWWEQFDVRGFLQAHLPEDEMAQVEQAHAAAPPAKIVSLMEIIDQAVQRISGEKPGGSSG